MPKVSVIIPAYNKADYTVKAVESVLNQTHKDIECIVVDDASLCNTHGALLRANIDWGKTTLIQQGYNQGASAARNAGIRYAIGDYIALLDCDDMYQKRKIELSIKDNPDFIYTCAHLIDKDDNIIGLYQPKRSNLLFRNSICNSVVIKRKCFDKVGLFDESLFICADWDMWLRMEEHYELTYLNMPLTYYRI
ncbi:hypothetical protein LCGC14_1372960 [marine sediment metagenome]|uniref:Glycosyltransferase 2-like domain-containing protein n=1 Tax=marine sediment metagenome TaxID=412755 RepID=A0A0F9KQY1_9ZZZZ